MAIKQKLPWIILIGVIALVVAAAIHEPEIQRTPSEIPLTLS